MPTAAPSIIIADRFQSPFDGSAGGQTISDIVGLLLSGSMALAGLIVLFLFLFAGFSIIMGAGGRNPDQAAKGRKAATYAVIGFFVIMFAYWVIIIIETISGIPFITMPGI